VKELDPHIAVQEAILPCAHAAPAAITKCDPITRCSEHRPCSSHAGSVRSAAVLTLLVYYAQKAQYVYFHCPPLPG
jgi:hypothetical protein